MLKSLIMWKLTDDLNSNTNFHILESTGFLQNFTSIFSSMFLTLHKIRMGFYPIWYNTSATPVGFNVTNLTFV